MLKNFVFVFTLRCVRFFVRVIRLLIEIFIIRGGNAVERGFINPYQIINRRTALRVRYVATILQFIHIFDRTQIVYESVKKNRSITHLGFI